MHVPKIGLKYYPLNRFVVHRDYCGNVLKAITTETIGFYALPKEIQGAVLEQLKIKEKTDEVKKLEEKELTLYTCYRKRGNHWITYQEVEGIEIPKTEGKYPIEACPFIALRYTRIDGESYGRGLIEEYIGDISYLDVLSKAIKEASLAASKCIALVNPNGRTNIKQLAATKNGGFCAGTADDVAMLQANKYYDLKTAREEKESLEKRLYRVFLLAQAVQRDSERTTATEIQYMIRDLEEALGNHYSIMSKEFQLAYIRIGFFHLRKEKRNQLPDLIRDKDVKLTVTTGLEALGRGSDLNKLTMFGQTMTQFAQMAQAKELSTHGKQDNISFFAFTATPKNKTLQLFGEKQENGTYRAFHIYSMRQAIEEGFILDVLQNYTTYKQYYKIAKKIEGDPEYDKVKGARAVSRFESLHPHNIAQKTAIIIEHFRDITKKKIDGHAKAMVVTASRLHAVRYLFEFRRYIEAHNYNDLDVLVAFSGSLKDDGQEWTEEKINKNKNGETIKESQLKDYFKNEFDMLIVAEKYQTGFDEPLLHTMFVDKKLNGVKAVQTLSRLNRTMRGKEDTFVLDFANEREEIQKAFQPYYEATVLEEETDPTNTIS